MELYSIIKKPLVTEKSTIARDEANKYAFEVDSRANKIEIKKAIETIFKVKVVEVRTMNMAGKRKRIGRIIGRKSDWKKAIVTLAPGASIGIFENV
ncbi:MAG: 50S ribosomal protein L23 [Syntrophales bacterium]|nr:50S ribosomal protein L23 [Syntrophales bacterium]MDD5233546.1 50S ribosomal protein L23 [Syntrophales bacterium]MDD5531745.1 50S ribosomal protein L23 [Syntrophales bacterium]HPL63957.1 50S ribosomal protein L23 [Syntrophales bacterium]